MYLKNYECNTPTYPMKFDGQNNEIFIKREDLLPFSFGGNKVRISLKYFEDMEKKGCNTMIAYGNRRSNLCRVIANLSKSKNIPCYIISPDNEPGDWHETNNEIIIKMTGAKVIKCSKSFVSSTILNTIANCKSDGLKPYYIYGDKYGKGNENTATSAYTEVYDEIKQYEISNNIQFDYIFHASGTGATQSGLVCGSLKHRDNCKIVGISIARIKDIGRPIIIKNIEKYISRGTYTDIEKKVFFEDEYLLGGYGNYNNKIIKVLKDVLNNAGVALDPIYTGKAFWGMEQYLEKMSIKNKKILFIHTGGLPLFFDLLNTKDIEGVRANDEL